MATSLYNIIAAIKDVALNEAGFASVEEVAVNMKSNADTELDKLFIKLTSLNYSKFLMDSALETYKLELIIIINSTTDPVSNLKSKIDLLLYKMFTTNNLLNNLARSEKIKLIDANLSNDRDLYSEYGGEGVTLRLEIMNVNAFNLSSCY